MAKKKNHKRSLINGPTAAPAKPTELQLSDEWIDNIRICDVLGVSASTIKRRRRDGTLIASKRFGKICFNKAHVEAFLRGGISGMAALLGFMPEMLIQM